jgi:hypothetical protein
MNITDIFSGVYGNSGLADFFCDQIGPHNKDEPSKNPLLLYGARESEKSCTTPQ